MIKIKVLTVFGTRPEAVKMAPLVHELQRHSEIESVVCVTAQHRQMLDQIMKVYGLNPDYDLDIMTPNQTLATITSKVLAGLDGVIDEVKPDIVLVVGDTTTVFAGALAAFYHKVPVGHVEAGLRTGDMYSPFPEEANRRMVGQITSLHFAPTPANAENLQKEHVTGMTFVTGNTVIDAIKLTVRDDYTFRSHDLQRLDFANRRVILVTAHRRENYGEPFENICRALKSVADTHPDTDIVYPVHRAPYVLDITEKILSGVENIHLIDPLDPDEMHNLMARCYMVMTDSGGLQEEAPALGKPVLVMRRETERPEAVHAGTVKLCGVEYADIFEMACDLLDDKKAYSAMANAVNPYGDGQASRRTVEAILWHFGLDDKPDAFRPQ